MLFFGVNGCKMVLFRFHKNWSILCHESGDSARVSGCRWHDATGCHRPPQLATRPGWEARNGYSNHSFYMFLYTKTLKTFFCCTVFTHKKPPPTSNSEGFSRAPPSHPDLTGGRKHRSAKYKSHHLSRWMESNKWISTDLCCKYM